MHWFEIFIGLLAGGFLGIAIMSALAVARKEEDRMEKNCVLFNYEKIEENGLANSVKKI